LRQEGFETVSASIPGYLHVVKGDSFFNTTAFKEGLCTVQDSSSAMAALLLGAEPGDMILDLCCAPGGKTTHLAEITGDSARIVAVDINPKRLGLVREAAARLGLQSISCVQGDAASFKNETGTFYDRILLDAPCTGTGVFSKRPDMKWRRNIQDLERMSALQKAMLHNAAGLVKKGGVIVYSTCTLEPEENENVVEWFIKNHDFYSETDEQFRDFETVNGYLILPHRMYGTGAFAAKLRRKYHEQ